MKLLEQAIKAQTLTGLAHAVGVRPNALNNWRKRGIPAKRALALEAATGIPRHKWRPDLYPRDAA